MQRNLPRDLTPVRFARSPVGRTHLMKPVDSSRSVCWLKASDSHVSYNSNFLGSLFSFAVVSNSHSRFLSASASRMRRRSSTAPS
jgi:hypothetical protein